MIFLKLVSRIELKNAEDCDLQKSFDVKHKLIKLSEEWITKQLHPYPKIEGHLRPCEKFFLFHVTVPKFKLDMVVSGQKHTIITLPSTY